MQNLENDELQVWKEKCLKQYENDQKLGRGR